MIVYPMGLPPHDMIHKEFENTEDLTGTQASLEVNIYIIKIDNLISNWYNLDKQKALKARDVLSFVLKM